MGQVLDLLGKWRVFEVLRLVGVHRVVTRGGVDGCFSRHDYLFFGRVNSLFTGLKSKGKVAFIAIISQSIRTRRCDVSDKIIRIRARPAAAF